MNVDLPVYDLRAALEQIGDCVVVVDDDEIIKVHVHTEEPGTVLQKLWCSGNYLLLKLKICVNKIVKLIN